MEDQLKKLEERISKLEKSGGAEAAPKKEKKPRKPNSFNIFMKDEIAKIKSETPGITHQQAFSKAAVNWTAKKVAVVVEEA
jgi:hypothetical protein